MNINIALAEEFETLIPPIDEEIALLKGIARKFRHNVELRCAYKETIDNLQEEKKKWKARIRHYQSIG